MKGWDPLLDRGDGVWLGVVDGNFLAVGSRSTVSKRIEPGNFVPLWPLLESGLNETATALSEVWLKLSSCGMDAPEALLQRVVESAIMNDRPYWVELSTRWLEGMAANERFDRSVVAALLQRVTESKNASQSTRHKAQGVLKSMRT